MKTILLIYVILTVLNLLFTYLKVKKFFGNVEYKFILFSVLPIVNIGYFFYIFFIIICNFVYYTYHIIIQIFLPYLLKEDKKKMNTESKFNYNFQYLIFGIYILTYKNKPIKDYTIDNNLCYELKNHYNLKTLKVKASGNLFDISSEKELFYCVGRKKTKMVLEYIHSYEMTKKLSK